MTITSSKTQTGSSLFFVSVQVDNLKPVAFSASYNAKNEVNDITVNVGSAMARAYGSLGKVFFSWEDAASNYKAKRKEAVNTAKQMIEEFANIKTPKK
jgi:hypothetical protein